jgi:rSAM/selenodomain-associated transferase 1
VTETVVFIFAKEPRPGAVKTRLCPPLTEAQAACCHRAFVADSVARFSGLAAHGSISVSLAATPDGDAPWLVRLAEEAAIPLTWQGGGDLGCRMERLLRRECTEGRAAVIVGSDTPDLPLERIRHAVSWLERPLAVVGPSDDGGYYLIGARGEVPPVFSPSCGWGSARLFEETLTLLAAGRWSYRLLEPWPDVDQFEDLRRLATRLRQGKVSGPSDAAVELPSTVGLLASLEADGLEI